MILLRCCLFLLAFDFVLKRVQVVLFYPIMLLQITAHQALPRLLNISADSSDDDSADSSELSNSELDDALTNDVEVELDSSEEDSDADSASEDNDSDSQNQA